MYGENQNKHNKLFMTAEPLKEELVNDFEEGRIKRSDSTKGR